MADFPMSAEFRAPEPSQSVGSLVNWAGAIVSLGLIVGVGVWGYQLLSRDVSGVPVVRATEGPMRIQPDDPGGRQAAHQGLAVNDVAAIGSAGRPADQLILAPSSQTLDNEDAAGSVLAEIDNVETTRLDVEPSPSDTIALPAALTADNVSQTDRSAIEQLAAEIAAGAVPLTPSAPVETAAVETSVSDVVAPSTAPLSGLNRSLRPRIRPASLGTAPATNAAPIEAAAASQTEVSEVPPGTNLVQLGAYASAEIARTEWDRLNAKFGDYLSDKQRVVQKATSGGRVFYRLRAMGFASLSDARRMCSAIKAGNADCIPVVTR